MWHIGGDDSHHRYLGDGIAGRIDGLDDVVIFLLTGDRHLVAEGVGVGAQVRRTVARRHQGDHLTIDVNDRIIVVIAHMADNTVHVPGRVDFLGRLDHEFR